MNIMQNIANGNLIAEAKYRLNNLSIDALISSGELEQLFANFIKFITDDKEIKVV